MAIEFSTPSFKPREYEGEYIQYTLYGLDSDGDELDDIITSPKKSTVIHTIKELLPDYRRIYNGMHVVAILYDENDNMLDSVVVWSTDQYESSSVDDPAWQVRVEFDLNGKREFTHIITRAGNEAEAKKNAAAYVGREYSGSKNIAVMDAKALPKHKSEKLSYEKGHKNSKGEDAPWVIRSHKDDSVLASFSTKKEAEKHMKTMKRYSKTESSGAPYIQRYVITGGTGPKSGTETARRKIKITGDPEQELWDLVLSEIRAGYEQRLFVNDTYYDCVGSDEGVAELREEGLAAFKEEYGIDKITSMGYYKNSWSGWMSDQIDYRIVDGASSENKDEGKFTEIKAAIKAAWSAAEAKWFRLDFREATERLDVYPIASDNEGVGVNWGVLPERNTIVQYATDLRTGDNQIEREMPYKDLDELEKIFVDEFKSMDETLEVGADNGADIHPLTESAPKEVSVDEDAGAKAEATFHDDVDIADGIDPIWLVEVHWVDPSEDDRLTVVRCDGEDMYDAKKRAVRYLEKERRAYNARVVSAELESPAKTEATLNALWCVEFCDIYSNVKKEYYDTEADAKARYDELAERGDIEWVEGPVMEAAAKEEAASYADYAESVKAILMGREFEYGPETANEFVVDDYKEIVRKNFDAGKNAFAAAADIDDAYMGKE